MTTENDQDLQVLIEYLAKVNEIIIKELCVDDKECIDLGKVRTEMNLLMRRLQAYGWFV